MPTPSPQSSVLSTRRRRSRGLALIEVLACVAISSMLLTAVAVAFRGSFNSYKDAQERGQLLDAGRDFMYRLVTDIRMADSAGPYDPNSTTFTNEKNQFASQIVPGNPVSGPPTSGGSGVLGIQLAKTHADSADPTASVANPVLITYWFDAPSNTVYMSRKTGAGAAVTSTMSPFIQSFTLYIQPVLVPANNSTGAAASIQMLRAVINTTLANKNASGGRILADGGQALTLSLNDSAMPRRTFGGS